MINNVTLTGRLTATPELKLTQSGVSVTGFSMAVDRRYTDKDGKRITDFINCVGWRNVAEFICRYFKCGDMIAITGEIQTRKYKDKDGGNRTAVEVVLNQASFCGNKNKGDDEPKYTATDSANFEEIDASDELPF